MILSLLFCILIFYQMTNTRIFIVALVIKSAFADFITGKVETQAQLLGMRPQGCCRPHATIDKSINILNVSSYILEPKGFS